MQTSAELGATEQSWDINLVEQNVRYIIGCSVTVLTPCHVILFLAQQHTHSKKMRAHSLLGSYTQRNCEPIAMTQMRVEDFRKVSLRDTEHNEMEERPKTSVEKEEVKSSSWDR